MILGSLATSPVAGEVPALLAGWLRQLLQPGERASASGPASTGVILMLNGHGDGVADIRAKQWQQIRRRGRATVTRSGPVMTAGTNFALFAVTAELVELCLFAADGAETRVALPEVDGFIWHSSGIATCRASDRASYVILDVVYDHTAEGDHLGPTLSFLGIDNAAYYGWWTTTGATTWTPPAPGTADRGTRTCSR
jgi:hypothetical protein